MVDDTTLVLLDQTLAFAGMKEELANMTKCQVGQVLSSGDVEEVKRSCPYLRVIQARWVTAFKSIDRVRARVVAKDIRSKESARSLGCSSPTPSCEVVQILLSLAATRGWRLRALDVSHAFMHSPLPSGTRVVLRIPSPSVPSKEIWCFLTCGNLSMECVTLLCIGCHSSPKPLPSWGYGMMNMNHVVFKVRLLRVAMFWGQW